MLKRLAIPFFSLGLLLSSTVHAEDFIRLDFKLEDLEKKKCEDQKVKVDGEHDKLIAFVQDSSFWKNLIAEGRHKNDPRLDKSIIIIPIDKEAIQQDELRPLGMTSKESVILSGDIKEEIYRDGSQNTWCAEGHDQGTMNNRYCHSAIARSFSNWLERRGIDPTVASFAGGIFWVPKEFLMDLNPSAHDIAFTYVDKLGTKSTTLEVTVFGDAFFKKYMGEDFKPFRSSTPFLTLKRKF